jgi:SHS2 domain-containing protein
VVDTGDYDLDVSFAGGDAGFTARGRSLEELFASCWNAALAVMVPDPRTVRRERRSTLSLESGSLEMLLFDFIQELIYRKDAESRFYRVENLRVEHPPAAGTGGRWRLSAVLGGEEIDSARHRVSVDVKAVTLLNFGVRQTGSGWAATVVLDV